MPIANLVKSGTNIFVIFCSSSIKIYKFNNIETVYYHFCFRQSRYRLDDKNVDFREKLVQTLSHFEGLQGRGCEERMLCELLLAASMSPNAKTNVKNFLDTFSERLKKIDNFIQCLLIYKQISRYYRENRGTEENIRSCQVPGLLFYKVRKHKETNLKLLLKYKVLIYYKY